MSDIVRDLMAKHRRQTIVVCAYWQNVGEDEDFASGFIISLPCTK